MFFAGIVVVLFMLVPYLVLGQDAIITYHDQLDGEVIAYILQAKHLFDSGVLPEFMGGMPKTVLIPPAWLSVVFFLNGNGFVGVVIMQLLGSLVGYVGMYLFIKYLTGNRLVGVFIGVIFAYLPFLPVYGFSQYGLPLLLYLIISVKCENKLTWIWLIGYSILFALNSSFVLVGFGVVISFALLIVIWLLQKKLKKPILFVMIIAWVSMFTVYMLENISLISQVFTRGDNVNGNVFVSHKSEYVTKAIGFWEGFIQNFINGGQHSEDYHKYFLCFIFLVVILYLILHLYFNYNYKLNENLFKVIVACIICNVFYCVVSALWNTTVIYEIRNKLGAAGAFQLERFLWIAPCLWYIAFGCSIVIGIDIFKFEMIYIKQYIDKKFSKYKKFNMLINRVVLGIFALIIILPILAVSVKVLLSSNLKPNMQKVLNPEYSAMSFNDYYAVGVMEQVDEFIGQDKSQYRVLSLGIDPVAALYNGFFTLDGYSNNYPVEYKHKFRAVIAKELEKSEYLKGYFDDWGNRCYLFSAECPGYYTVQKGAFYFADFSIDIDKLDEICSEYPKYLISAAYIANAKECGLVLLREAPFESDESYYRLYVYKCGEF